MTATTDVRTDQTRHDLDRLRRAGRAIRDMFSAIRAWWRAEFAAGQLGPDPETTIGRGTGARV